MLEIPLRWRRGVHIGRAPSISGRIWVHGGGRVRIGDRVQLDACRAPIELYAGRNAVISIGDDVVIEGGASIEAQESITLGARCRVGAFCKIIDNHHHPLRGDRHQKTVPAPVAVGRGAVLGPRVVVLAGAQVPPGSVIAPATVVRAPPPAARRAAPARNDG